MTFTERAGTIAPAARPVREPVERSRAMRSWRAARAHQQRITGSEQSVRGLSRWRRREHASASDSGRSAGKRACRSTTSRRVRASSSKRRCSVPTSAASGRSRCPGCCAWPRSTRCRPTSCCPRVRGRDQPRQTARPARSTSRTAVHDRPGAPARRRRSRRADALDRFATSIQLERQDFNGRMLTIRRSDLRVLAACMGRSLEELGVAARAARPPRRASDRLADRPALAGDRPPPARLP